MRAKAMGRRTLGYRRARSQARRTIKCMGIAHLPANATGTQKHLSFCQRHLSFWLWGRDKVFIGGCCGDTLARGAESGRTWTVLRNDLRCARLSLPTIG